MGSIWVMYGHAHMGLPIWAPYTNVCWDTVLINSVRDALHRMEIIGQPLSNTKLAWSLDDLWKAMKKPFLVEILVHSVFSQPSLLRGGQIWHSLKDHWEIIGRSMRLLSAYWTLIECSLSVCWAFVERLLSICWEIAFLGDHWEILSIAGRSLGALWQITQRSGHFFIMQHSLTDRDPWVKGVLVCSFM